MSERERYLNAVESRYAIWGGQVAGFHSTRRNEALPLVPFFAAILKVRSSRLGALVDVNRVIIGIRFSRAC